MSYINTILHIKRNLFCVRVDLLKYDRASHYTQ
jgi:hypothetical protein